MTEETNTKIIYEGMPKLIMGMLVFVGALLIFLIMGIFMWKPWKYEDATYRHEISSRDSIIAEKDKRIDLLFSSNTDKDSKIKLFYSQDSALAELHNMQQLILNRLQITNETIKNRINAPSFTKDSTRNSYSNFR